MKIKRFVIVLMIFALSICSIGISASDAKQHDSDVKKFVTDFLTQKSYNEWMYQDNDLSDFFVQTSSPHLSNFLATIDLYKAWRSDNQTHRLDFKVWYTDFDIQVQDDQYQVTVKENLSYIIDDGLNLTSTATETYLLTLKRTQDTFVITDISIPYDSFYTDHKYTGFNAATLLSQNATLRNTNNVSEAVKIVDGDRLLKTAQSTKSIVTIPYNEGTAISYARLFATNYNTKFPNFSNAGGDCANFASQCVWAGFYGNYGTDTTSNNITQGKYPMDTQGSSLLTQWFCKTTGVGNYSASWVYANASSANVSSLYKYPQAIANAGSTESGWIADVYQVTTGTLPNINYGGCVLLVPGYGGVEYGHAIFAIMGSNYTNIRFCAHTGDKDNVLLSDYFQDYVSSNLRIVKPLSYKRYSTCNHTYRTNISGTGYSSVCSNCGYLNMYFTNPWSTATAGSPFMLTGREINGNTCYQINVKIYNNNNSLVYQNSVSNNYFYSFQPTLSTVGLYKVKVEVTDCNPSNSFSTTQTFWSNLRVK